MTARKETKNSRLMTKDLHIYQNTQGEAFFIVTIQNKDIHISFDCQTPKDAIELHRLFHDRLDHIRIVSKHLPYDLTVYEIGGINDGVA